jgi:hypothetical protein
MQETQQRERPRATATTSTTSGPMTWQPRRQRRAQTKRTARLSLRGKMTRNERHLAFHRLWANLMKMSREAGKRI